jgi:nicotinate-nucleotide adenylyltransferase
MQALRSLGIFGGSFNPVHSGHVLLARQAREALKLDQVWLLPCSGSADGKALAPGALRLRWLRKALRGEEGLLASDLELKRGGVSRTIDTLRQVRALLGPGTRVTLLLGQDQALRLHRWKEAGQIPSLARIAIFARPGFPQLVPKGFKARFLSTGQFQISSSEIRQYIRQKRNLRLWVPPALERDADLWRAFSELSTK